MKSSHLPLLNVFTAFTAATFTLNSANIYAGAEDTIRAALTKLVPGVTIDRIEPSPIAGLYEVLVGSQVMYVTEDGHYYIDGRIVDLTNRKDLTEPKLADARKHLLDKISEDQMVIFSPTEVKHTITVFTDVDCGYCRKFHSQIAEYGKEGIRVRYVFFPRAGKDSASYKKAVSIWCAGDEAARRSALTDAKSGKEVPAKTCDNPVAKHLALGQDLGLRGTPALVTESGDLIPGYVEPKRLAAELNGNNDHKN